MARIDRRSDSNWWINLLLELEVLIHNLICLGQSLWVKSGLKNLVATLNHLAMGADLHNPHRPKALNRSNRDVLVMTYLNHVSSLSCWVSMALEILLKHGKLIT